MAITGCSFVYNKDVPKIPFGVSTNLLSSWQSDLHLHKTYSQTIMWQDILGGPKGTTKTFGSTMRTYFSFNHGKEELEIRFHDLKQNILLKFDIDVYMTMTFNKPDE